MCAFISQMIRQRSTHDAGTNDHHSFALSISHITSILSNSPWYDGWSISPPENLIVQNAVSVSAPGRLRPFVTGRKWPKADALLSKANV
jgi:hypothetical protein